MFPRTRSILALGAALALLAAPADFAYAQASNPCNPCGPKVQNPCNPCGGKGGSTHGQVAVNPSHAQQGTVFYIADPMGRDSASFTSEAPLEDIVGTTNKISGYVVFDPKNPTKSGRGTLVVPIASIDTGIPLRDEHLRSEAWLDAKRFPEITFHIDETKNLKEVSGTPDFQTYELTLVGRLSLHGRTKKMEVPARITYIRESATTRQKAPGDLLAGRATLGIQLSDFGITGPKGMEILGAKVSEAPSIEVRFVASSQAPKAMNPCNPCGGEAENPCNPCGGKAKK